jgi:hypothetical protein
LTTAGDEATPPPKDGSVGMVHPLELDSAVRQAWIQHLATHEITPPFPQLDRAVIKPEPELRTRKIFEDLADIELNAMTFRSRAEKRGWVRGSVCDGGAIFFYFKRFSTFGVDAFLGLNDMSVNADRDSGITLDDYFFVRSNSVPIGDHINDEPHNEHDPRLIAAGDVPPIAYSEALGDILQIARTTTK